MKRIISCLACLCFLQVTSGQPNDPFVRLKVAAQRTPVERQVLPQVKITKENPKWKAVVKPAIPFRPFTLLDSNGNRIPPDMIITLKGGAKITAQEYLNRLNEVEQKLNAQGHTLRSKKPVLVSRNFTANDFLAGKVARFPQPVTPMRKGESLKSFMSVEKRVGTVVLKPVSMYSAAEKREVDSYDFKTAPSGILATKTTKKRVRSPLIDNIAALGFVKPLKTIEVTNSKDWDVGDPATFQAGIEGKLYRYAKIYPFDPAHPDKSMSAFKVSASGRVFGALMDNSLDLLVALGEFNAPADTSKKMSANLQVKVAGITILNLSQQYAQHMDFNDDIGRSFDKSIPIDVPIGWGFDFKGKIGVKGEAGFEYGGNLYRSFASVQGKPLVNLEGYAEAGLEFLNFIGGGIGGRLTFLRGELELQAFAGIWAQNADEIVLGVTFYSGYELEMLKGSLYCYVEICAPWVGCWRPVEHEFFSWDGYKSSGTLAEGSATYTLANVWERERPAAVLERN